MDQLSAEMQLRLASERLQCGVVRLACCQQEIAPQARMVVPAQAQGFRALDCERAHLLHRQGGDAVGHGWRHRKDHRGHAAILAGHLPAEHQRLECEPVPACRGRRAIDVIARMGAVAPGHTPPCNVAESQVDDHKWKERQALSRDRIEVAPEIAVGADDRERMARRAVERKLPAEFDELQVQLMGQAYRPGALPFVLRELLTVRPLSVARIFRAHRRQISHTKWHCWEPSRRKRPQVSGAFMAETSAG